MADAGRLCNRTESDRQTIESKVDARLLLHASQGMLAVHPCALSSLDQSLKKMQVGHSCHLGA